MLQHLRAFVADPYHTHVYDCVYKLHGALAPRKLCSCLAHLLKINYSSLAAAHRSVQSRVFVINQPCIGVEAGRHNQQLASARIILAAALVLNLFPQPWCDGLLSEHAECTNHCSGKKVLPPRYAAVCRAGRHTQPLQHSSWHQAAAQHDNKQDHLACAARRE